MSSETLLRRLRAQAINHSLSQPTTLSAAMERLGFVQADPIRSPARAQDLILRQRVEDYHAGDLERAYPSLDLEEDYLYAYGFLPRPAWRLLHPRRTGSLPRLERNVLAAVRDLGPVHPGQLEARFGGRRIVNAWGGYSKATKRALERLHHHGHLRIARRENGVRVYELAPAPADPMPPDDRFRGILLLVTRILAPITERTLHAIASRIRRWTGFGATSRKLLRALLHTGELEQRSLDGVNYFWPASPSVHEEPARRVRFLAPFDPIVWDRGRFERFWGWPYRFEAYTPTAKRLRGYYAMPLLWGDDVIGWANASVVAGRLNVETGFVSRRPRSRDYRIEEEAEIARLEAFLERNGAVRRP